MSEATVTPVAADWKEGQEDHPWLGLVPYSEDDQRLFFGRERETEQLFRLIRREALTVVFGQSGTGKSSLLKAGVFPRLRQAHYLPIWIRLDQSGGISHDRQIKARFDEAVGTAKIEVDSLNSPIGSGEESVWEYLHRTDFWDARNQPVTPVLVFDQFEEVFTLGKSQKWVGAFLEELADLVENYIPSTIRREIESGDIKLPDCYSEQRYKVVITLREDFVARLDGLRKAMPSVMHNRFYLERMKGNQALNVVLKPGGHLVEEEVAREIVKFVAADQAEHVDENGGIDAEEKFRRVRVEPALLSLVCRELNQRRIERGKDKITLRQVQGSRDDILEGFFESSLEGLSGSDRAFIEDRLVTASGFRSTVPLEDAISADLTEDEVETLIHRRLIRKEGRLGIPHIELTHDVLTGVVARSRDLRKERERIEEDRRKEEGEKAEMRRRLEVARTKKSRRNWTLVSAVMCVLSVCLFVAVWRAEYQKRQAHLQRDIANSSLRAANHQVVITQGLNSNIESNPELALILATEAMSDLTRRTHFLDPTMKQVLLNLNEFALRKTIRNSLIRGRYLGHRGRVASVDFDHDSRRMVTGARYPDSSAIIWDLKSQKEIVRLDHETIPQLRREKLSVSCVRFSPDGNQVLTATYREGGFAHVWEVGRFRQKEKEDSLLPKTVNQPLVTFDRHEGYVTSADYSPDGSLVATGGYDKLIRLWDPETGEEDENSPLEGHAGIIRSIKFFSDGTRLLSTSNDGKALIWDLSAAHEKSVEEGTVSKTQTPEVVGNTSNYASAMGSDATSQNQNDLLPRRVIREFDPLAALNALRVEKSAMREWMNSGDVSPSGKIVATVGNDGRLCVWDVGSGRLLAVDRHPDPPMDVKFVGEKRLVTVCNDSAIRFWKLENSWEEPDVSLHFRSASITGLTLSLVGVQRGHEGWIRTVAVRPDHRHVATGGDDETVRLWRIPPGSELAALSEQSTSYRGADLFRYDDGLRVFVGTEDGGVHVWDGYSEELLEKWGEGKVNGEMVSHTLGVKALSLSPDGGKLVTASSDQTAIVWDVSSGRPLFQITGHREVFGLNGELLRGGGTVYRARFSPDGESIVTAGNDKVVGVWDTNQGDLKLKLDVGSRVYDARFCFDGRRIVTADFDASSATVWDAKSGEKLVTLGKSRDPEKGHSDIVLSAAFSPDGRQVVTASTDGYTRIWDSESGELDEIFSHGGAVRSAEFSPDGHLILTGGADGIARLWELNTNGGGLDPRLRVEMPGHVDTIYEAKFSKGDEGSLILTDSRDGVVRLSYEDKWAVYSLGCQRVTRVLTLRERLVHRLDRELKRSDLDDLLKNGEITPLQRDYYLKNGSFPNEGVKIDPGSR